MISTQLDALYYEYFSTNCDNHIGYFKYSETKLHSGKIVKL